MEKKYQEVKAVVQPIDRKGNVTGSPIEVYDRGVLEGGEKIVRVRNRYGVSDYARELRISTKKKRETLSGYYYGLYEYYEMFTPLVIEVQDDKVTLGYLFSPNCRARIRRGGRTEIRIMDDREVIREGEYVDFEIGAYREIGREGDVPIVEYDAWIRVEARKLRE